MIICFPIQSLTLDISDTDVLARGKHKHIYFMARLLGEEMLLWGSTKHEIGRDTFWNYCGSYCQEQAVLWNVVASTQWSFVFTNLQSHPPMVQLSWHPAKAAEPGGMAFSLYSPWRTCHRAHWGGRWCSEKCTRHRDTPVEPQGCCHFVILTNFGLSVLLTTLCLWPLSCLLGA